MPASEAKTSRIETLIRQLQGRTARDILYGSGLSAASFGGGVALTAAIPHGLQDDDGNPVAPSWAVVGDRVDGRDGPGHRVVSGDPVGCHEPVCAGADCRWRHEPEFP
jgi:hypothetical protein